MMSGIADGSNVTYAVAARDWLLATLALQVNRIQVCRRGQDIILVFLYHCSSIFFVNPHKI
jgi:hypothetical protein